MSAITLFQSDYFVWGSTTAALTAGPPPNFWNSVLGSAAVSTSTIEAVVTEALLSTCKDKL